MPYSNDNQLVFIISVFFRILHPDKPPISMGDLETSLRHSLIEMEPIVLRFLKFDLTVDIPHNHVYTILHSLKNFYSVQFEKATKLETIASTLLQDLSIAPEFMLSHSSLTIAVTVVALALQLSKVEVHERKWIYLYSDSVGYTRLQRMKQKFVEKVYNKR